MLRAEMPTESVLTRAAQAAGGEAKPIGDMRASASYRTALARVLTLRALREAVRCAGAEVAA
jgi:carbon-monoxide dehydrogenase medium subunit